MKKYYSLERIKKIEADYKILLSGRNVGKSYAVKSDVLKEAYNKKIEFTYLRRWNEDIKGGSVINYFADLNILKITNGEYDRIHVYQSKIYFALYDNEKVVKKQLIGHAHSLNQAERYKSQMFPKVEYTIFEECVSDKGYLNDEPSTLEDYVSTIYRERKGVVYMVGNMISKLCPYYGKWHLAKVLSMKPGDIQLFENTVKILTQAGEHTIVVKIVVERCMAVGVFSRMAFGDAASMIAKNTWKQSSAPTVSKDVLDCSDSIYNVYVKMDNLTFRMDLMAYGNVYYWYVRPQTKQLMNEENERVISQDPALNALHTVGFIPLNDKERLAFSMILDKRVFFCDDSCGTDFMQVLKKYRMIKI